MAELKAFGALQARNRLSRALAGHVGGGFEPETHEISLSSFNSQQLLDPTPVRHAGDTLVCRAHAGPHFADFLPLFTLKKGPNLFRLSTL